MGKFIRFARLDSELLNQQKDSVAPNQIVDKLAVNPEVEQQPEVATTVDNPSPAEPEKFAEPKKKKRKQRRFAPVISLLLALAGVGMLLYPVIATRVNNARQQEIAQEYSKLVKDVPKEDIEKSLAEADKYNHDLATGVILDPFLEDVKPDSVQYQNYLQKLSLTEVMSQVSVPTANINLPVYHGTDDAVLKKGVGHLYGSALPVGGDSTHAVLTGHTGLESATLFDGLTKVKKGDPIYLNTLDRKLKYVVTDINVVIPTDTQKLVKVQGKDLVTLITCTPYAINSHRLLVTGERVYLPPEEAKKLPPAPVNPWLWWMILLVVMAVLSILLIGGVLGRFFWVMWRRKRKQDEDDSENSNSATKKTASENKEGDGESPENTATENSCAEAKDLGEAEPETGSATIPNLSEAVAGLQADLLEKTTSPAEVANDETATDFSVDRGVEVEDFLSVKPSDLNLEDATAEVQTPVEPAPIELEIVDGEALAIGVGEGKLDTSTTELPDDKVAETKIESTEAEANQRVIGKNFPSSLAKTDKYPKRSQNGKAHKGFFTAIPAKHSSK